MDGILFARLGGSVVLVVAVTIALQRIWIRARRQSGGGHPLSGLPLAFAWLATAILAPATLLIVGLVLVPWERVFG